MKKIVICLLLFGPIALKSQNHNYLKITLDSLFSYEIKENNVFIGENHYQSENTDVYLSILNSMNSNTCLFIEGPFFMNVLIEDWLIGKTNNLIDFRRDYSKLVSYDYKSNLLDTLFNTFQDSGRGVLRNFKYVDLNDLSFWMNRKYVLKLLLPYLNDLSLKLWVESNLEKEFFDDEDWMIFSKVIFECRVPENELWKKFRNTLFNEIENRRNLPVSNKSKLETFASRELILIDNFNFFRHKIPQKNHYFVISGIAHISRDNSIRVDLKKIKGFRSFTNGIPNSQYFNLFYFSELRKPYNQHIGCSWEKKILKSLKDERLFPQIIDVRQWNSSYDKMIVL